MDIEFFDYLVYLEGLEFEGLDFGFGYEPLKIENQNTRESITSNKETIIQNENIYKILEKEVKTHANEVKSEVIRLIEVEKVERGEIEKKVKKLEGAILKKDFEEKLDFLSKIQLLFQ